MQGNSRAQNGERRRRRKKRSFSSKIAKYRTLIIGFLLILVGLLSTLYTFDYQPDLDSWFQWDKMKDLINLWPFGIVLAGFIFVIIDYIRNSSKSKYK